MPIYLFENTTTQEVHEVVYHMNETKDYRGPDGNSKPGIWRRVWVNPQASFDTKCDPFSAKDFAKATNKGGVVGDMWERSAEMSAKREEKAGKDPIKEGFYQRFSAKRRGKQHPQQRREESVEKLKKVGITVKDWGD